ncbi:thiosulfate sulfurtransferase [Renibacterium salmoninarum ATCC 33209]|uniref:Thiosulfate sulfurtransferase n=2 Tax=Renibacterium salmoninarum TaxID=1646 RepID=A9WPZ7_RENSM|nr:thiosulfate sulfurtransferase [Renibacterium salmoninarum ATCC 33209]
MASPASMANMTNILIDAQKLQDRLDHGERTVLIDVRWVLGDPQGYQHYLDGHLPGAIFANLETELAGHGDPQDGRHPLPAEESFQETVRRWGINAGDFVVVYDDSGNMAAARLWWLLRHAGMESVAMLDGGLGAWAAASYPVETGPSVLTAPGNAEINFGQMPVISIKDAGEWSSHGVLLDARAAQRYRGEVEPIDPKAGHIPGALSAPTAGNLTSSKQFLPAN